MRYFLLVACLLFASSANAGWFFPWRQVHKKVTVTCEDGQCLKKQVDVHVDRPGVDVDVQREVRYRPYNRRTVERTIEYRGPFRKSVKIQKGSAE